MTNEKVPRTRKIIKRISELSSLGLGATQIADKVNKELNTKLDNRMVTRMIQKGATITGKFLHSDKKITEFYREIVKDMINEVKKNLNMLNETREIILKRLDQIKGDMPESKMMGYITQINAIARSLNDTVRTMNENLKRLESQATEVKITASQQVHQTLQILRELEDQGYIIINKDYYDSSLFKEFNKLTPEDEGEKE